MEPKDFYIFQKDRKKLHCYRALIKSNVLLKAGPALKLYDVAQGLVQAGFEDLKVPRFHSILGDSVLVLSYSLLFCSLFLTGGHPSRENSDTWVGN